MDDEAFFEKYYRIMTQGTEEEKEEFRKSLPKKLSLEDIKRYIEDYAPTIMNDKLSSNIEGIKRSIIAIAAQAICEAQSKGGKTPRYDEFRKTCDYVSERMANAGTEFCNFDEVLYFLQFEELPKIGDAERMFV